MYVVCACAYYSQGFPVHGGAAEIQVLPVHHPKGGMELTSDQNGGVDIVDIGT